MALKKGKSDETVSENIKELMHEKPDARRKKAIKTIAKKKKITFHEAKQKQAVAIALSKARE
jgi:hypothetical protein